MILHRSCPLPTHAGEEYNEHTLPSAPELLDNILRKNRGSTARGINSCLPGPISAYQSTTSTRRSPSCLAELCNQPGQLAQLHLVCGLPIKKPARDVDILQFVERTIDVSADEQILCSPEPELWKMFLYAEFLALKCF